LVIDHFHVEKLANAAIDDARRRVQQETTGHRGRKGDPLYGGVAMAISLAGARGPQMLAEALHLQPGRGEPRRPGDRLMPSPRTAVTTSRSRERRLVGLGHDLGRVRTRPLRPRRRRHLPDRSRRHHVRTARWMILSCKENRVS
jgi:hypothetical protein